MGKRGETFLVIDIGSSKISGVLGEIKNREIIIHSSGFEPTVGISDGVVVSIDDAKKSILNLIKKLKVKGVKFPKEAHVLITGSHLRNIYSEGIVAIGKDNHKDSLITRNHIEMALEQAEKTSIPPSEEIVSIFPSAYYVNGKLVKKPHNMMGVRLKVETFILTGDSTHLKNIELALLSSNIKVKEFLYQPIMASYGALTFEDRDTGVLLVDIGRHTTDIAVWEGGSLLFSKTLNTGGEDITEDIATVLHIRKSDAEQLKIQHGTCETETVDKKSTVSIEAFDRERRSINKKELAEIIRARVEDIFLEIRNELRKNNLIFVDREGYVSSQVISIGAVLVGGTTLLPGIKEVGESILQLPCISGKLLWKKVPKGMDSPAFASLWGAIEYKYRQLKEDPTGELVKKERFKKFFEDIKDFFKYNL